MPIARAKHAKTVRRPPAANVQKPTASSQSPTANSQAPAFQDAQQAIREARDEIVDSIIQKAKRGSYLHAKFLFDFAGLSSDAFREAYEQEGSLARILLNQLSSEGVAVPGYSPATAGPRKESV